VVGRFIIRNVSRERIWLSQVFLDVIGLPPPGSDTCAAKFPVVEGVVLDGGAEYEYRQSRSFDASYSGCSLGVRPWFVNDVGSWILFKPVQELKLEIYGIPRAPR